LHPNATKAASPAMPITPHTVRCGSAAAFSRRLL
jgi:hypothetical protein